MVEEEENHNELNHVYKPKKFLNHLQAHYEWENYLNKIPSLNKTYLGSYQHTTFK